MSLNVLCVCSQKFLITSAIVQNTFSEQIMPQSSFNKRPSRLASSFPRPNRLSARSRPHFRDERKSITFCQQHDKNFECNFRRQPIRASKGSLPVAGYAVSRRSCAHSRRFIFARSPREFFHPVPLCLIVCACSYFGISFKPLKRTVN